LGCMGDYFCNFKPGNAYYLSYLVDNLAGRKFCNGYTWFYAWVWAFKQILAVKKSYCHGKSRSAQGENGTKVGEIRDFRNCGRRMDDSSFISFLRLINYC